MTSEVAQLTSSLANQLASETPKLGGDISNYASSIVSGAPFATAASRLEPVLPDDAKSQLATDPAGFVIQLITESTTPVWADVIPTDVIGYFGSVDNDVNSIIHNDLTLPPLPRPTRTTLGPRPGSSGTTTVPIVTSSASTVATAPAGSGVLPSRSIGSGTGSVGSGTGSGTGRVVTPTTPSSTSVSQFSSGSASRWNSMTGAVAALLAVGVGAILLA